ncbi:helix-hairpin-helix domain-containing protein [Streptomyces sp. NPDC001606]
MALRSRSRSTRATSGPGRAPGSDGRHGDCLRHRPGTDRRRSRHRPPAPAEELRRRAELLFDERAAHWRESGNAPPDTEAPAQPAAATATATGSVSGMGRKGKVLTADAEQVGPEPGLAPEQPLPVRLRERLGPAVRERMPVWLQTRCAVERRGVMALAVVLVAAVGFAAQQYWTGRTETVSAPQVVRAETPSTRGSDDVKPARVTGVPATPGGQIVVDVSGKVRKPGIQWLPAGSRVADALRAAGGVRPGTDIAGLNRARFLVDGEQVAVGAPAAPPVPAGPPGGAATSPAGAGPATPVSLNTATADQLDTLPGVGPVLARHILDYRTQHGGFRSVDELREVNGIGDRRFGDLRNLVRP